MKNNLSKTTNEVSTSPTVDDQARRELLARIYRLILSSDWMVEEAEEEYELGQTTDNQPAG